VSPRVGVPDGDLFGSVLVPTYVQNGIFEPITSVFWVVKVSF
jgi:hypothetical protein